MKVKEQKNGAWTTFERYHGWYVVMLYNSAGQLLDKMRCDTYRGGLEYLRAFNQTPSGQTYITAASEAVQRPKTLPWRTQVLPSQRANCPRSIG